MKYIKQNIMIIVLGFAVMISGASLMIVSQRVYNTQKNVTKMNADALALEWEIRALNAELAFLSRPDRLDQIASAMTHSISPAMGERIVVAPVSYSFSPVQPSSQSTNLIPPQKPSYVAVSSRVSTPKTPVVKYHAPVKKTIERQADFSNLLNDLGGDR